MARLDLIEIILSLYQLFIKEMNLVLFVRQLRLMRFDYLLTR